MVAPVTTPTIMEIVIAVVIASTLIALVMLPKAGPPAKETSVHAFSDVGLAHQGLASMLMEMHT